MIAYNGEVSQEGECQILEVVEDVTGIMILYIIYIQYAKYWDSQGLPRKPSFVLQYFGKSGRALGLCRASLRVQNNIYGIGSSQVK